MSSNTDHVNMTSHHVSNYFVMWIATVPMVTVSLVTLTANGTVLVMFAIRPSLRRAKNAYLASLALADFLIGCYMPLLVLEEMGLVRVEGTRACRTYLTVRYSLLYVSLLSVLLITLDRWWSVRWPFSYRTRHTRRLAAYLITALWVLSTTLYALPIFLWDATSASLSVLPGQAHHLHTPNSQPVDGQTDSSRSAILQVRTTADLPSGHTLQPGECEVPYVFSFAWSALTCFVMYLLPLGSMWILNCSLYQKIRLRKSVEIRRSTSVTDMFFVTMKNSKPTIHITEAPSLVGPPSCNDIPTPSSPLMPMRSESPTHHSTPQLNSLHPGYTTPTMGRRHSSALVAVCPQQQELRRQLSQRRVSLPDWALRGDWSPSSPSNTSSRCRYVGRKWSGCGGGSSTALAQGGLEAPGGSSSALFLSQDPLCGNDGEGGKRPSENGAVDTVHELLVKQDQKVACCLALLLAACTVCWLPFACLTLLRAHCPPCVTRSAIVLCRWLLLANSAVNPFLYGLLNAQFRNILRQWFYLDTSQRYRPARDTYVYMGVSRQDHGRGELSAARDTSHVALSVMAPSSGR